MTVNPLEAAGLVEKIDPYQLALGKCQRCKTVVQPLVSTQWFVRMKPLAEPAIRAVGRRLHSFHPGKPDQDLFRVDG